ncbi:hypothetical protein J2W14_001690 [Pseudarthrobacter oxydans]|nr:hypothetical protein [Pseudarthrobacter oxydans]
MAIGTPGGGAASPAQPIDCSATALLGAQKGGYGAIDGEEGPYFSPAPGSSSVAPRESATNA